MNISEPQSRVKPKMSQQLEKQNKKNIIVNGILEDRDLHEVNILQNGVEQL